MKSSLPSPRLKLPQISTDQLWPLIVLAGFSFFASLMPLPPNDFWWHLKIGEIIYTHSSIPTTNLFAWTLSPDHPFVYGAWLSELLFYVIYRLGRLELVVFARNIMAILAFWLVGYEAKRRSGSWRLALLAVALAGAMSLNNLPIRPQIWSWLPFVAYLIILGKYTDGQVGWRSLLLCPLIMIFWVNAHGAFILGGAMIGVFFVGESLRKLMGLPGARSWKQVIWIGATGALSGLAMLINPRFINISRYVADLLTDRPSQSLIVEWQSPTPEGIANVVFFASILLLLAVIAYSYHKLTPTEALLAVSFLWLAWTGQRYVVWFGMAAMPILVRLIQGLPVPAPRLTPQRSFLNVLLAAAIFLPILFVQPWFVERFPLPKKFWDMVQRNTEIGPLVGVETPLQAASYLKEHPGGKIFNEMGYGSYLIWAVPDQNVFIDPRVELYPFEQWEDYLRITRGVRYNELLDKYGADRILLDIELQPELAAVLKTDAAWRLEYEDSRSQVWIKR